MKKWFNDTFRGDKGKQPTSQKTGEAKGGMLGIMVKDAEKEKNEVLSKLPEILSELDREKKSSMSYGPDFAKTTSQLVKYAERLEKWVSPRRKTLHIDDWEYDSVIKGTYPEIRNAYYKSKNSLIQQKAVWDASQGLLERIEKKLRDWQQVQ